VGEQPADDDMDAALRRLLDSTGDDSTGDDSTSEDSSGVEGTGGPQA